MGDSMDSTAAEALVQVLCVQGGVLLVGYAIGVASPDLDATLLSRFVASVSLPALLFRSVATLDSSSINYRFLVAMLLAKWAVASFAALTGSALMRAPRLGAAGLSALLATTGNELAFSLPVVATVLPHMTAQVLLLSAVQSILVNPVLLTAVDMSAAAEKAKAKAAQRLGVRGADELAAAEAGAADDGGGVGESRQLGAKHPGGGDASGGADLPRAIPRSLSTDGVPRSLSLSSLHSYMSELQSSAERAIPPISRWPPSILALLRALHSVFTNPATLAVLLGLLYNLNHGLINSATRGGRAQALAATVGAANSSFGGYGFDATHNGTSAATETRAELAAAQYLSRVAARAAEDAVADADALAAAAASAAATDAFRAHGGPPTLPATLDALFRTLGDAFPATALFTLGIAVARSPSTASSRRGGGGAGRPSAASEAHETERHALATMALLMCKLVLLPACSRLLVLALVPAGACEPAHALADAAGGAAADACASATADALAWSNLAWLCGASPAAPWLAALATATADERRAALASRVVIGSLLLAFPLTLGAVALLGAAGGAQLAELAGAFSQAASALSLAATALVVLPRALRALRRRARVARAALERALRKAAAAAWRARVRGGRCCWPDCVGALRYAQMTVKPTEPELAVAPVAVALSAAQSSPRLYLHAAAGAAAAGKGGPAADARGCAHVVLPVLEEAPALAAAVRREAGPLSPLARKIPLSLSDSSALGDSLTWRRTGLSSSKVAPQLQHGGPPGPHHQRRQQVLHLHSPRTAHAHSHDGPHHTSPLALALTRLHAQQQHSHRHGHAGGFDDDRAASDCGRDSDDEGSSGGSGGSERGGRGGHGGPADACTATGWHHLAPEVGRLILCQFALALGALLLRASAAERGTATHTCLYGWMRAFRLLCALQTLRVAAPHISPPPPFPERASGGRLAYGCALLRLSGALLASLFLAGDASHAARREEDEAADAAAGYRSPSLPSQLAAVVPSRGRGGGASCHAADSSVEGASDGKGGASGDGAALAAARRRQQWASARAVAVACVCLAGTLPFQLSRSARGGAQLGGADADADAAYAQGGDAWAGGAAASSSASFAASLPDWVLVGGRPQLLFEMALNAALIAAVGAAVRATLRHGAREADAATACAEELLLPAALSDASAAADGGAHGGGRIGGGGVGSVLPESVLLLLLGFRCLLQYAPLISQLTGTGTLRSGGVLYLIWLIVIALHDAQGAATVLLHLRSSLAEARIGGGGGGEGEGAADCGSGGSGGARGGRSGAQGARPRRSLSGRSPSGFGGSLAFGSAGRSGFPRSPLAVAVEGSQLLELSPGGQGGHGSSTPGGWGWHGGAERGLARGSSQQRELRRSHRRTLLDYIRIGNLLRF